MPNDATKSSSKDFDHLMIRSRPIFHIPHDIPTDTEDASPRMTESPEHMNEEMSGEGSWSDNDSDDTWHSEKAKDDIRKYHALKELLATEVGYLLDLRALVTVRLFFSFLRACLYILYRYTFASCLPLYAVRRYPQPLAARHRHLLQVPGLTRTPMLTQQPFLRPPLS